MEILLVESNSGDICLIKEAIKEVDNNCNLTAIQDGSKAISYISDGNHRIDLLILSTNLIKANAFEILKECKSMSLLRNIPIFVFGDGDDENEKVCNLGTAQFYQKPGDAAEYFKVVESFIKTVTDSCI